MTNQSVYFKDIRNIIIENIESADNEILIAVAWFTDTAIIQSLVRSSEKGVKISIVIFDDKINNKDLFKELYYKAQDVRVSKKLMHNKFCVIDKKTVINGSYNWTNNAATNNENIQITFNNESLATSFIQEFRAIQGRCNTVDRHFKYSFERIINEEQNFLSLYHKQISVKKPYFYKFNNPKPLRTIPNIPDGYYLIRTEDEECNFLKQIYFSNSEYKLLEVEKIINKKFTLPNLYHHIDLQSFEEKVPFNSDKVLVQQNSFYGRGTAIDKRFLFFINKEGEQIGEKIQLSRKTLDDDQFYIGEDNKLYDKNLAVVFQENGSIEKAIKDIGIVTKIESKYGLFDFDGKLILPHCYDGFEKSGDNDVLQFSEYPMIFLKKSSLDFDNIQKFTPENTKNFYFKPRKLTKINQGQFLFEIINNSENFKFYFYSDENFRYAELYKALYLDYYFIKLNEKDFSIFKNEYLKKNISKSEVSAKEFISNFRNQQVEKAKELSKKQESNCYIATAVYKNINHPKVEYLRNYRDSVLVSYKIGRIFIKYYYKYSPKVAKKLAHNDILNNIVRNLLDCIIKVI